jgi:hypothetical protein
LIGENGKVLAEKQDHIEAVSSLLPLLEQQSPAPGQRDRRSQENECCSAKLE